MKTTSEMIIEELIERYPTLSSVKDSIVASSNAIVDCYRSGGKVLICGNGGSASDSDHIVGELLKGFKLRRTLGEAEKEKFKVLFPDEYESLTSRLQGSLPAISLVSQAAIISAFCNDVDPEMSYAQQVYGYANKGDVVIGLSTSGNAKNVGNAIKVAKVKGAITVGFTGIGGGKLKDLCDILINVPATETFKIQELHLPVYHAICAYVENELFGE